MSDLPFRLFNVLHANGKKWTNDEIEKYMHDHDYDYELGCFYTFVIDDEGTLYVMDKYGNSEKIKDLEDFKVEFDLNQIHDKKIEEIKEKIQTALGAVF